MNEGYKKVIVVVVGVFLIILMAISFGGRDRITWVESKLGDVIAPVQRALSGFGNFLNDRIEPIVNVLNYKSLNEELTSENERLKEKVVSLTMTQKELNELESLSNRLNYVDSHQIEDYVTCNVIAKDTGNWFNMFTIDAGSNQGITKNSTVITGRGLVGLVYETGDSWSKVISIIDHKSSVGFEMLRADNDFDGTLNGTTHYELVGDLYDTKAQVADGDYIITSGIGMYPKGILIGQIYEVVDDKDLFLKQIKVKPAVDFKKLNKVMVIPYHDDSDALSDYEE